MEGWFSTRLGSRKKFGRGGLLNVVPTSDLSQRTQRLCGYP